VFICVHPWLIFFPRVNGYDFVDIRTDQTEDFDFVGRFGVGIDVLESSQDGNDSISTLPIEFDFGNGTVSSRS